MPTNVDSLSIQISAEAKNAEASLNKLVSKLDTLSASLGRINSSNFSSFSANIRNLSSAMQSMQNIKMPDYTRLAKGIEKLGSINSAQITSAGQAIRQLSSSLQVLDTINISDNAIQLAELARGISQLGYKSSTQAIDNIPRLATAMQGLMNTLSQVPRVSQNLIDMTNALARLARTGASSGRAADSLGRSLNIFSASANSATRSSFSLAATIGKLYANYWLLLRAFKGFGKAITLASDLTEIQNVVDTTFGNMAYKVEEFTRTSIEQFGMSELTLKQVASRFQAMGSAMNINSNAIADANKYLNEQTNGYIGLSNSMADVSLNLTKLTADMASFYNLEQDVVAEDLQSIFTGTTKPLRQYGIDLTEINLKQWAMTQGLNSNIDSMTQAEKVLLRYQYVLAHTGAAQGDFAKTADTWSNQVRVLKQNFQQLASIIGGTLINALKPLVKALNAVMGYIISFAKTVSNALGKIFGWTYEEGSGGGLTSDFEGAAEGAEDIAGSTGKAADNINKMQASLRSFDELKNINMPDTDSGSSGSGGAGGGAGGAGGTGGEWKQTDSIIKNFESEIDTLYELGEYIGNTLTKAMNNIDWNKTYESARNWGKGLANFLNGLISPELFGATGRTIAGSLNTALYFLNSFGKTFDWKDFGLSIATGINEFFRTFDFKNLADTINVWFKGVFTTVATMLKKTDFELIGKKIGEFLKELDFTGIIKDVAKALWEAIKGAFKLLKGLFEEAPLETALLLGLATAKFTKLGSKIVSKIVSAITEKWSFDLGTLLNGDMATIIAQGTIADKAVLLGATIASSIAAGIAGFEIGKEIGEMLNPQDSEWYDNFTWFGDGGFFPSITEDFGTSLDGLKEMLTDFENNPVIAMLSNILAGPFVSAIAHIWKMKEKIEESSEEISKIINDLKTKLKKYGEEIKTNLVTKTTEMVTEVKTKYEEIREKISELVEKAKTTVTGKFEEIRKNISEKVSSAYSTARTYFSYILSTISTNVTEALKKVRENFEAIKNKISETLTTAQNKVKEVLTNIYTRIKENSENAYEKVKSYFEKIKSKINEVMTGVKTSIEKFTTAVNDAIKSIKDFFTQSGKTFKITLPTDTFSKFFDSIKNVIDKLKELFGYNGQTVTVNTNTNSSSATAQKDGGVFVNGSWKPIQQFAFGGMPNQGQLFYAREAGPELVGTIGGNTAVMNNNQIVESVSAGVYSAVVAALSQLKGLSNVTIQVEGDPNGIFRVVQKKANEYQRMTGNPAFI